MRVNSLPVPVDPVKSTPAAAKSKTFDRNDDWNLKQTLKGMKTFAWKFKWKLKRMKKNCIFSIFAERTIS